MCPACGSLERHRLLWLYLRRRGDFLARGLRVLAPGGEALIMVPLLGDTTDEDPDASPDERVRRFGQADHVRLYGATDLVARIAAAGLQPRVDHLHPTRAQIERHRLIPAGGSPDDPNFTDVFVGVRAAGPEPPPPS